MTGGLISEVDRDLYYSMITLVRGDLENYGRFMEQVDGTEHDQWATAYA